MLLIEVAEDS